MVCSRKVSDHVDSIRTVLNRNSLVTTVRIRAGGEVRKVANVKGACLIDQKSVRLSQKGVMPISQRSPLHLQNKSKFRRDVPSDGICASHSNLAVEIKWVGYPTHNRRDASQLTGRCLSTGRSNYHEP